MNVHFNQHEIDVILEWFDFSISTSQPFGGVHALFPSELILMKKLTSGSGDITINKSELELLSEVMEASVQRKYGNRTFLFGFEQQVFRKVLSLLLGFNKDSEV